MSLLSDRLERLQYSLIWTANVVLEVRWGIGPAMVTRRRRSVFVSDEPVQVGFPSNDVMGQEPRRATVKSTANHQPLVSTTPLCRWFVTSQAPVSVLKIAMVHDGSACDGPTDDLAMKIARAAQQARFVVGAVCGTLKVPAYYGVIFEIARDSHWLETAKKGIDENGK